MCSLVDITAIFMFSCIAILVLAFAAVVIKSLFRD